MYLIYSILVFTCKFLLLSINLKEQFDIWGNMLIHFLVELNEEIGGTFMFAW